MSHLAKLAGAFTLAILLGALVFTVGQSRRGTGEPRPGDGLGPRRHPPGPPDGLNPRILDQLSLTDEQRLQVDTLHDTARAEAAGFASQLKVNREQIAALVKSNEFDETQARKLLAAKAQLFTELDVIHLRTEAAVYALLTAEQKTQAEQLRQQGPPFPPPSFRGERPTVGD